MSEIDERNLIIDHVTFRIMNDVTREWCLDVVQINGSAVWWAIEQRAIVFGCALKHFRPRLDVPKTWLPCNIYACMNIYCDCEYACVKEGQMRKNKVMKTFQLNGCLRHWTPRMKIVFSVRWNTSLWAVENLLVVVLPILMYVCLFWGQCRIIFHWFLVLGRSVNIALLYQPINHKK